MASNEADRLAELEARLNALEGDKSGGSTSPAASDVPDEQQAALIQAFLQGALVGNAAGQNAAPSGGEAGAPAFLSIFSCGGGGGGGWSPTNYDSVFWCKSRFMCNPSSLSCLC